MDLCAVHTHVIKVSSIDIYPFSFKHLRIVTFSLLSFFFPWHIFFHSLTVTLFVSLNLKCFCCRLDIELGHIFFYYIWIIFLLIGMFILFTIKIITHKVGLSSNILFSVYLVLIFCLSMTAFFYVKYFLVFHFNSFVVNLLLYVFLN